MWPVYKIIDEPLEVNLSGKYQEFTECGNGTRFFHHTSVIKQNQNKGQNPLENLKTALKVQGWLLYVLPYDCEIPLPEYPPAPISIKPKLVSPKGILNYQPC